MFLPLSLSRQFFFCFIHLLTLNLNISYKICYTELICLADLYVITADFKYIISRKTMHVGILYYIGVPSITVDIWAVEGCKGKTLVTSTSPKLDIFWKNSWNWKQASDFQSFMRQFLNYSETLLRGILWTAVAARRPNTLLTWLLFLEGLQLLVGVWCLDPARQS